MGQIRYASFSERGVRTDNEKMSLVSYNNFSMF